MSKNILDVDPKQPKRKHNFKRDAILVALGLLMVAAVFCADDRFNIDSNKFLSGLKSNSLVYFAGPMKPQELGLDNKDLKPLLDYAEQNKKNIKQLEIHIERQDTYGSLTDSTELRFFIITRYHFGAETESVVTRAKLGSLVRRLVWRVREDTTKYLEVRQKMRGKDIKGFTNTM